MFKRDKCSWHHSKEDCSEYIQGGKCKDRICITMHRKVCRYWANSFQVCRRRFSCQYLHSNVKKKVKVDDMNEAKLDNKTNSYEDTKSEYEQEHHIDVMISFEEQIKNTVMNILMEIREENYSKEETDDDE